MHDPFLAEMLEPAEEAWARIIREEEFRNVFGGSNPVVSAWDGLHFV